MGELKFDDFADLGNHMYELANEDSQVVTAVLLYEDAVELIKWIMLYDDITVGRISIEHEDYNGYDKEFYITIDADLVLDVTPAYQLQTDKTVEGYLTIESDIILFGGDVSSRLALQHTYGNKYEIVFEDYDDEYECINLCVSLNYPHREISEAIEGVLNLIDYTFN